MNINNFFNRKSYIIFAIIISFLFGIIFSAKVISFSYNIAFFIPDVKKFRLKPNYDYFYRIFHDNGIINYIKKYGILINGSEIYNEEIIRYIKICEVKNNWLNRKLISNFYSSIKPDMLLHNYEIYPFEYKYIEHALKVAFFRTESECNILELFSIYYDEYGDEYYFFLSEYKEYLGNPENYGFSFKSDSYISPHKSIIILKDIFNELKFNNYFLKILQNSPKKYLNEKYDWNISQLLQTGTEASLNFLNWYINRPLEETDPIIVACFTKSTKEEERKIVFNHLLKNKNKIPFEHLIILLDYSDADSEICKLIFNISLDRSFDQSVAVFHQIIHKDMVVAELLAKKFLQGEDSKLKKSMIVLLVRHGSVLGGEYIDDSFTGLSPRVEYYQHTEQYIYGSKASKEYTYVSRHDYLETGKSFPPVYCEPPLENEVKLWKDFIQKYPWFPGTDDAYYRLAFRLFVDGDINQAKDVIRKYNQTTFSDNDIETTMRQLEKHITKYEKGKINKTFSNINEVYINSDCNEQDN